MQNNNQKLTVTDVLKDLKKVENNKKKSLKPKPDNSYIVNKGLQTEWENLELMEDGSIVNHGKRRNFKLPIGLNELLYFMEIEKDLTFQSATEIREKYNIKPGTFGKIIHNIRETDNFAPLINKYKNNLKKASFSLRKNILFINNLDTNIKMEDAKDWISIIANTNKKNSMIIKIQEGNPDVDKEIIRFICDSYDNPKLINLLKNKPHKFIENNPSKRKNLIANGGLI